MTRKQQAFANEYLVDLNATQAAIRAGYSAKTAEQQGYQLLQNPSVRAAVDEALQARAARTEISQDWVVERLVENVDRALTAVPVYDREGNRTGEYTYQGSVANGALKMLGQHVGMFSDKVEVTGQMEVTSDVDAALERFAALTAAAVRGVARAGARAGALPPDEG